MAGMASHGGVGRVEESCFQPPKEIRVPKNGRGSPDLKHNCQASSKKIIPPQKKSDKKRVRTWLQASTQREP